jgi:prolyl 4-hydroxylase
MQLPPQIAQAYSLVAAGRAPEAVSMLGRLAAGGDGPACYQLAEWRREGQFVARDFALARDLYRRAGEAGLVEGMRRYLALVAVGIGGRRDWQESLRLLAALARIDPLAERQLSLVQSMALTPDGDPASIPEPETLSKSPGLTRFPGLFSEAECQYLGEAAEPLYEPAVTVEEYTGREFRTPIRTSDTAVFPWVGENPAIHALNRRIAAASRTDATQGEPLQILRYRQGQEYKPHIDAIPGLVPQRIFTMLVYLNDGFEGGETTFLKIGLTIAPRRGDGLLFHNVGADGKPDQDLLHAGLPVRRGVKRLASRWIRERAVTE